MALALAGIPAVSSAGCLIAANPTGAYQERETDAQVRAYLQAMLDRKPEKDERPRKRALHIGPWTWQPEGYAYRTPEGMESVTPVRGTNLVLRDACESESAMSLTTISVTVVKTNESLEGITLERTQSAYAATFTDFELTEFIRESYCDAQCVRISYMAGAAPRLYVRQYMFDQDGQRYTVTLSTESKLANIIQGLAWLESFSGSLLFRTSDEALASQG